MNNLTKKDAYQTITDQIIAGMEKLEGNWKASWAKRGLPINAEGESYNGLNIIVLFMAAHVNGFSHNEWGTYKTWKKRGGIVRKGQKATARIIRWVQINEKDDAGDDTEKSFMIPKAYAVFNIEQVDGVEPRSIKVNNEIETIDRCENYFNATLADVNLGGDSAFYDPKRDEIWMPRMYAFRSAESFYAVLAHEVVHWTGITHRLNRFNATASTPRTDYAYEELVAELGSAFICADLGIVEDETRTDHIEYIGHWVKLLKSDPKAIFTASREARKAKEFLDKTVAKTLASANRRAA